MFGCASVPLSQHRCSLWFCSECSSSLNSNLVQLPVDVRLISVEISFIAKSCLESLSCNICLRWANCELAIICLRLCSQMSSCLLRTVCIVLYLRVCFTLACSTVWIQIKHWYVQIFFSKYYNVHDIQSIQSITTHTFNGPLSRTTRVSRYQKGKTNLDFTEARDSEWQWHQLGHMQSASRSRQRTTPAPHHSVFYRLDALPAAQPTASKHWRQSISTNKTKYGSTF